MKKAARQERYTTNWEAIAAERGTEIASLRGQISSIVAEIGGMVEGHPTGSHNVLQRVRELIDIEKALTESIKLQNHYGHLLNMHDGGERMQFPSVQSWIDRLRAVKTV